MVKYLNTQKSQVKRQLIELLNLNMAEKFIYSIMKRYKKDFHAIKKAIWEMQNDGCCQNYIIHYINTSTEYGILQQKDILMISNVIANHYLNTKFQGNNKLMLENYFWYRIITPVGQHIMIKSKYQRYVIEREVLLKRLKTLPATYKLIYPNPLRI